MARALDMTGFWIGEYRYRWTGMPAVPFFANLEEAASALTGTIDEPNMVGASSARLSSFIQGRRNDLSVEFAKVYDGASDMAHRVDYRGTLSADGLTPSGAWFLEGDTGAFRMTREAVEEVEQEAEADEVDMRTPSLVEHRR
ncbi:MAG TPA: hypothetical protein VEZ48_01345 [Sphingomonadaceae bacterium]|nr:hypothetical protein [Sphingomonadaceae bacterium]